MKSCSSLWRCNDTVKRDDGDVRCYLSWTERLNEYLTSKSIGIGRHRLLLRVRWHPIFSRFTWDLRVEILLWPDFSLLAAGAILRYSLVLKSYQEYSQIPTSLSSIQGLTVIMGSQTATNAFPSIRACVFDMVCIGGAPFFLFGNV
jgi:hypothetical protein